MHTLTGTSAVYGIFGDPVAHSLSPTMQNAAFVAAGLDAVYVPFHVTPATLPAALDGLRALGIRGINATIPHKERIIPFLDEVDADAALIGAVNTVVLSEGKLIGYNTDAPGFIRAVVEETGFRPQGAEVILLGAGGACRAALVALSRSGVARLTVVNRSPLRAEELLGEFRETFPHTQYASCPLDDQVAEVVMGCDLLVNTTAVGLHGEEFTLPLCDWLRSSAVVYDMVYRRGTTTPLVAGALRRGVMAADGLSMLAAQGEEAFRLWFGSPPPFGVMKGSLLALK